MVDTSFLVCSMDWIEDGSLHQSMSIDLDDSNDDDSLIDDQEIDFPPSDPLESKLLELSEDESIDAAIQRVALANIIYGKTVKTADEIAKLCFVYQSQGYYLQAEKHMNILKEHAKGRPGARMENNDKLLEVKTKVAIVEAQHYLYKKEYGIAFEQISKAEKIFPKSMNHMQADKLRNILYDVKLKILIAQKQHVEATKIIDERIKRETDTDEKIKLILEKSRISTTKIAVIEEALLLATENDLKFQEAESYFEIGKVNLELNKLDSAIEFFYKAISIFNEVIGQRNKISIQSHSMLGKCHVLNGNNELALKVLPKNQANIEAVFGLVSDEAADGLQLEGSIHLSQGDIKTSYRKLTNALEIYDALNPKHPEKMKLQKIIKSLEKHPEIVKLNGSKVGVADRARFQSTKTSR